MNSSKLEIDIKRRRWQAAQSIKTDWETILNKETFESLLNCSLSKGTPIDFFVMPLLSTSASLMNDAYILANKKTGWTEPSIIWTVVSAPAGKSNVIPVLELEVSIYTRSRFGNASKYFRHLTFLQKLISYISCHTFPCIWCLFNFPCLRYNTNLSNSR